MTPSWFNSLFRPNDKQVNDVCPVCKTDLGIDHLRVERIYYCYDCEWIVQFHPYETVPKMIKKKRKSNMDSNYTPYQEDMWMLRNLPPIPGQEEGSPPPP